MTLTWRSLFFSHVLGDIDLYLYEECGAVLATSSSVSDDESVSTRNDSLLPATYSGQVRLFSGNCNLYDLAVILTPNQAPQPVAPPSASGRSKGFEGVQISVEVLASDDLAYTIEQCSTPEATENPLPGVVLIVPTSALTPGQRIFFQGLVRDNSDTSGKGFSATNAVEVAPRLECWQLS